MKILRVDFKEKLPFKNQVACATFLADCPPFEIVLEPGAIPFVWIQKVEYRGEKRERFVMEEHGAPLANVASIQRETPEGPTPAAEAKPKK